MKLSLGTSPAWGHEVTGAGATESRDCKDSGKEEIHGNGGPCMPAQPRDPLLCQGRGRGKDALSDAGNLLGSPQGASGSEESAYFLTKEVFKVSFRLQSAE